MPDDDTFYWKIDTGNDWGLKFFRDRDDAFGIQYRYAQRSVAGEETERAFVLWIASRYSAVLVNVDDTGPTGAPAEHVPVSHSGAGR
jgi:hypothetical protein